MFSKEIIDPVVWNQYINMPNGDLAMKTNEILVNHRCGLSIFAVSLGTSSVNNSIVSKIDASQTGGSAEVQKSGVTDSVFKSLSFTSWKKTRLQLAKLKCGRRNAVEGNV
jgi:hypothetical protein